MFQSASLAWPNTAQVPTHSQPMAGQQNAVALTRAGTSQATGEGRSSFASGSSQANFAARHSAVQAFLAQSRSTGLYPAGVTPQTIQEKIQDLTTRNILAGPNCWGTVAHLLGITPHYRYISEHEFNDFVRQAPIIPAKNAFKKNGAVLSIWNNAGGIVEPQHAALLVDKDNQMFFEKVGPDAKDALQYGSLEETLQQAETGLYGKVALVDSFQQAKPGKYATFLDFSNVARTQRSPLETKIAEFHVTGDLSNGQALMDILAAYYEEIPQIRNARDLSIAEGLHHLLKSIDESAQELQAAVQGGDRRMESRQALRKLSNLSTATNAHKGFIAEQIRVYSVG